MGSGRRGKNGSRVLSDREVEVLSVVARGMKNVEVAVTLSISEATVKRHLANAYEKMGVGSRSEAVSLAVRSGLLTAEELWGPLSLDGTALFRCAESGCGCMVAVVRESSDPEAKGSAPLCHGREMDRVEGPASG